MINVALQMLAGTPNNKQQDAQRYLQAVQEGLKKVQLAIDLKYAYPLICL